MLAALSHSKSHRLQIRHFSAYTNRVLHTQDTKTVFDSKKTPDLVHRFLVLKFISWDWVANYGPRLLSIFDTIGLQKLVYALFMKPIVFRHFCAGEKTDEALQIVQTHPLKAVLFLSVEPGHDHDESWFDQVAAQYADCASKSVILKGAFGALKIGGLTHGAFLKKLSAIVKNVPMSTATTLDSNQAVVDFICSKADLTDPEIKELGKLLNRLDLIFRAASESKVYQLIDAEQSYYQDMIDFLALFSMKKYNKEAPVVWSTYQLYRKDTRRKLEEHIHLAEKHDFHIAFKTVRGAYMLEESRLAKEHNYPNPIHDTLQNTHDDYNSTVRFVLELIHAEKKVHLMVASHNEQSADLAASYMKELGIPNDSPKVYFAQLQGMCDHISYAILAARFNACKLYPYGPVEEMMPYLLRRLNENKGFMGITSVERALIRKELQRRCMKE